MYLFSLSNHVCVLIRFQHALHAVYPFQLLDEQIRLRHTSDFNTLNLTLKGYGIQG